MLAFTTKCKGVFPGQLCAKLPGFFDWLVVFPPACIDFEMQIIRIARIGVMFINETLLALYLC